MVDADVGKPARRLLLTSLKLTTACIAVKRTPVSVDVLYTSAKTLWTVRNINKGGNPPLFLVCWWFAANMVHVATNFEWNSFSL